MAKNRKASKTPRTSRTVKPSKRRSAPEVNPTPVDLTERAAPEMGTMKLPNGHRPGRAHKVTDPTDPLASCDSVTKKTLEAGPHELAMRDYLSFLGELTDASPFAVWLASRTISHTPSHPSTAPSELISNVELTKLLSIASSVEERLHELCMARSYASIWSHAYEMEGMDKFRAILSEKSLSLDNELDSLVQFAEALGGRTCMPPPMDDSPAKRAADAA